MPEKIGAPPMMKAQVAASVTFEAPNGSKITVRSLKLNGRWTFYTEHVRVSGNVDAVSAPTSDAAYGLAEALYKECGGEA